MNNSTLAITNTIIQYIRSAVSILIVLYTTRVILDALGAVDYGIYNLVAGVVAMLSFVQASLTQTTQRYMAYYIGRRDAIMQRTTFFNSLFIQLILSLIIVAILLVLEPVLFQYFLEVPQERLWVARILYKLVLGSLFCTMVSAPYMATLIANENILYYSIVNILDSLLLIPIALLIQDASIDRLLLYGVLITLIKVVNLLLYFIYCLSKYNGCISHSITLFNRSSVREMLSFSIWTTYGASVPLIRNQGIAVVLNNYMSTIANAAYGLGLQIYGQIGVVTASIMNAVGPQIIKAEGCGDRQKMIRLSEISSKICFYLVAFVAVPLFFEFDTLLSLWLKDVPENTSMFCRILLITLWMDQMTIGLATSNQAVGSIKEYTLVISSIKLLVLPLTFFAFYNGCSPVVSLLPFIVCELLSSISRIFVAYYTFGLNIITFFRNIILKEIMISSIVFCLIYMYVSIFEFPSRFLITFLASTIVLSLFVWRWGLEQEEKAILTSFVNKIFRK